MTQQFIYDEHMMILTSDGLQVQNVSLQHVCCQVDKSTPTGTCAVCVVDRDRSLVACLAAANNFKCLQSQLLQSLSTGPTTTNLLYELVTSLHRHASTSFQEGFARCPALHQLSFCQ
ncbi:hypothetical protein CEUSTIGMA_g4093.t1 [Chlamydomonas eustigma]|uniref:Uncharacterized protein n=1 Tax=Chlamydomonas eustigma TaxID=1157962 RepID=A0A250X0P6_9CHLO|nr:hypothetical protein CEUSTIGMA_g4093.t1 [Chlamydomonas eustigma]|eukprot:GAX76647.1 hypothetical protein CEUSTIGMA_g4093.t1 [Chlamydomonas eustigma]